MAGAALLVVAGTKVERITSEGSQQTLQVLGQVLGTEPPEAAPEEAAPEPKSERGRSDGVARRRMLPPDLPRVVIEVLPLEVQRGGLEAVPRPR